MKIKTIEAKSKEEIDRLCNEFEAVNTVRATQSHVDYVGGAKHFTYVLFYTEE